MVRRRKTDNEEPDRYYFRISACSGLEELEEVRTLLAKRVGRVWDHGAGTAVDTRSGWFEVRPKPSVRDRLPFILKKYELWSRIAEMFPIVRGDGKDHARQLSLISGRMVVS